MYKILWMISLGCISQGAWAEWVEIERSEIQTTFANPSVSRTGWSKVRMTQMSDYKAPRRYDDKTFLSVSSQLEFKCKERQMQMLSYTLYSGHMGEGRVVGNREDTGKWNAVTPGSLDETLLEMACEKK